MTMLSNLVFVPLPLGVIVKPMASVKLFSSPHCISKVLISILSVLDTDIPQDSGCH